MATQSNEIRSYFGRCRCCLEYGYLKNMWTVHHWEGESEIYGEMMTQCFAFSLEQIKGVDKDQLCATCITRLRDACNFKYMIIRSQRLLMQEDVCEGDSLNFKLEPVKPENSFDSDTGDDTKDVPEVVEEMEIIQMDEKAPAEEHSYEDVEYLEEEIVTEKVVEEPEVSDSKLEESDESAPRKPKWPKKLPRNERNKRYLQYTEEDLRKSIEAVKSKKMSRIEAAQYYNVPQKTLTAKLRQHSENVAGNDKSEQSINNSQTFTDNNLDASEYQSHKSNAQTDEDINDIFEIDKYRHNLSTILQFSNATMIHGHWGVGYTCYFCTRQFPLATQLKQHNLRSHRKSVNPIEQDNENNLLLKLDITGLYCKVCNLKMSSIKKLIKHLKKIHRKHFYDVKNYIVPFKFDTEELQCALCAKKFGHFKLLSDHTVQHYQNFQCWLCNNWFINQHTLDLHLYRHQGGAYECSYCSKIFDTASEKSEHVRVAHYLSNQTTQCPYCDEAFESNLQLEEHKAKIHGIKQQVYECRSCSITFINETYLRAHQKRFHLLVRPHKCFTCYMSFYSQMELNMHRVKDKDCRKFACEICDKTYSTRCKLNQHSLLHFDHRRFSCHYCNLNFVFKYKWKEHMRNMHPKIITLDSD